RAPHALIDLIEPWESYSVSRFLLNVKTEINRVHASGGVPLLVGGTMMYFQAIWKGISNLPESEPQTRQRLEQEMATDGLASLYQRLRVIDPQAALRIDANDRQRILRALEVYELSGQPLSQLQNRRARGFDHDFYNIGLFPQDRTQLHANIKERFKIMLACGFINEVEKLLEEPQMSAEVPSMRCVGYRQACGHLHGQYTIDEMSDKAIAATRQLAKRQITWMRKMDNVNMYDPAVSIKDLMADERFTHWLNAQPRNL
ncbi:MAG: tRNA (adenosine(37)-N6)-dimethylallyltransferase MiaA, partial [Pseudomonadota bacterium]